MTKSVQEKQGKSMSKKRFKPESLVTLSINFKALNSYCYWKHLANISPQIFQPRFYGWYFLRKCREQVVQINHLSSQKDEIS